MIRSCKPACRLKSGVFIHMCSFTVVSIDLMITLLTIVMKLQHWSLIILTLLNKHWAASFTLQTQLSTLRSELIQNANQILQLPLLAMGFYQIPAGRDDGEGAGRVRNGRKHRGRNWSGSTRLNRRAHQLRKWAWAPIKLHILEAAQSSFVIQLQIHNRQVSVRRGPRLLFVNIWNNCMQQLFHRLFHDRSLKHLLPLLGNSSCSANKLRDCTRRWISAWKEL